MPRRAPANGGRHALVTVTCAGMSASVLSQMRSPRSSLSVSPGLSQ